MATKDQIEAATDAVLMVAANHGAIARSYITRPIAQEVARAALAAAEAFADPLSSKGQA